MNNVNLPLGQRDTTELAGGYPLALRRIFDILRQRREVREAIDSGTGWEPTVDVSDYCVIPDPCKRGKAQS